MKKSKNATRFEKNAVGRAELQAQKRALLALKEGQDRLQNWLNKLPYVEANCFDLTKETNRWAIFVSGSRNIEVNQLVYTQDGVLWGYYAYAPGMYNGRWYTLTIPGAADKCPKPILFDVPREDNCGLFFLPYQINLEKLESPNYTTSGPLGWVEPRAFGKKDLIRLGAWFPSDIHEKDARVLLGINE